ncbi:hypothetical protein [Paraburkholderia dilworthii]|uniref:Roadblock/LAMTOR2 domain-containing protein n=1 Tax=Paraburkholderia dilworthii TaxID=948106 RepID=A0ABW9DJX2_9BURK
MTDANEVMDGSEEPVSESLQTLVEYFELSLDKAVSVVLIRHTTDVCTVYIGDPAGLLEELKKIGAIAIPLANEMLERTRSGVNRMQIGGQVYRFVRTFTQIGDSAAVVFSTA